MYNFTANRDLMAKVLCDLGYQRMHIWRDSHSEATHEFWQAPESRFEMVGTDKCIVLYLNDTGELYNFAEEKRNIRLANRLITMDEENEAYDMLEKRGTLLVEKEDWMVKTLSECHAFERFEPHEIKMFMESWKREGNWQHSSCGTCSWADFKLNIASDKYITFRVRRVAGHPNVAVQ